MYIVIICCPVCDVINFGIKLNLDMKPVFFFITKKSRQKCKYLKNEKSFSYKIINIFHHFKGFFSCQKLSKTREWAFNIRSEILQRFLNFSCLDNEHILNVTYRNGCFCHKIQLLHLFIRYSLLFCKMLTFGENSFPYVFRYAQGFTSSNKLKGNELFSCFITHLVIKT